MDHLKVAIIAAKAAGKVHKKYFGKDLRINTKSATFDLLTVADTEAEEAAVKTIQKYFPGHNFLTEEKTWEKKNSEYFWIIDPLDGTNNFVSGLPIFCSSVALIKNQEIIAGAIYDVTRDELFYAAKGRGAFLNGRPIRVSAVDDLKRSVLITGFYYDRDKKMLECLDNIKTALQKRILGLRRLGAAALDLAYIASGRAAGFWEFCLSPWDFAAGKLIVEEAGGKITDNHGLKIDPFKKSYIVASNARIHSALLSILKP